MIRFGSVCSGIEAASIAFAPLGWAAAWLAEVDVAASAVLAYRLGATAPVYPLDPDEPGLSLEDRKTRLNAIKAAGKMTWGDQITNYGDFTKLVDLVHSGEAEAPDALVGGTPCQAFSLAGHRQGMKDARGGLTLAFVDLADAIDDIRADRGDEPCIVMWENVPGVLSDKGNAFGCFLAAIAGEDEPLVPSGGKWTNAGFVLGPKRAVAWRIGDAQYFGLAQRRRRIIVVASAREGFDPGRVLFEFDSLRRDTAPSREAGEGATHSLAPCLTSSGRGVERTGDPRGQDPVIACDRPGIDIRIEVQAVPPLWDGREVSQTLDAVLYKGQTMPEKNRFPAVLQPIYPILEAGARTGASTNDARAGMGIGDEGDPMYTLQASKQHAIAFSCKDYGGDATDDLSPTMRAMGHAGSHANAGGQLAVCYGLTTEQTPKFNNDCALTLTKQSPSGGGQPQAVAYAFQPRIARIARNGRGDMGDLVNALTAQAGETGKGDAAPCVAVCVTGSVTHTLKADGFDGSEDGTGRGQPIVNTTTMAVRRLMPVECERLQGFPDGWTLVPVGKKLAADGPRYKQLGNSWATKHIAWVGRRLDAEIKRCAAERPDLEFEYDPLLMLWALASC